MPEISACIISYNEEKKIEACLQSLVDLVDEIVVVDSQSQDRTVEIARRYTDRVIEQPFLGYVEQKNFAVDQASHDWILALDCDERVSPELRKSIMEIKGVIDRFDAYKIARRTFYVYRWINHCWYPDAKIRLFNRRKARWGGVNPHDRVEVSEGKTGWLDGDILHYSFDSISDHLDTIDRFTEIGAQELLARGRKVGILTPLTHGSWTFIKVYFLKRGFLDGFAGFVVAVLSFTHAFVKYSKAWIMKNYPSGPREGGG
ncbi:MAG: glycosyltransferase family 2 protein [Gammaproteobacteria bacterium]